jgi:hypothetical protein
MRGRTMSVRREVRRRGGSRGVGPSGAVVVALVPVFVFVFAVVLGGCGNRPDPRAPAGRDPELTSFGGWIEVTTRDRQIEGELIAVGANRRLFVLTGERSAAKGWVGKHLVVLHAREITSAKLYAYEGDSYWSAGTVLGVLSLPTTFIAPVIWILTIAVENQQLDQHRIFSYPGGALAVLARWARFPQGPPPGLGVAPVAAGSATAPARRPR